MMFAAMLSANAESRSEYIARYRKRDNRDSQGDDVERQKEPILAQKAAAGPIPPGPLPIGHVREKRCEQGCYDLRCQRFVGKWAATAGMYEEVECADIDHVSECSNGSKPGKFCHTAAHSRREISHAPRLGVGGVDGALRRPQHGKLVGHLQLADSELIAQRWPSPGTAG